MGTCPLEPLVEKHNRFYGVTISYAIPIQKRKLIFNQPGQEIKYVVDHVSLRTEFHPHMQNALKEQNKTKKTTHIVQMSWEFILKAGGVFKSLLS